MKNVSIMCMCSCLCSLFIGSASARDVSQLRAPFARSWSADELADMLDPDLRGCYESTAADTYTIVHYDFESGWQGWTSVDRTAQISNFFHVDDFAGVAPGSYGRLMAIEGTKSMWCGTRPNPSDPYLCSWNKAPGYGNGWNQVLITDPITFTGIITFSYRGAFDSEPDNDFTYVEYDAGGGDWRRVETYTGVEEATEEFRLVLNQVRTKLRFRFISDDSWSDQDGLWNTDGGAIVDNLRISDDVGIISFEDFEAAAVDAKDVGIWHSRMGPAFGTYSGLMYNLIDKDPCNDNRSRQVVFFFGSPYPSSDYPGLFDTPYYTEVDGMLLCQDEMIVSPPINLANLPTSMNGGSQPSLSAGLYITFGKAGTSLSFEAAIEKNGCKIDAGHYLITPGNKKASGERYSFAELSRSLGSNPDVRLGIRILDPFKLFKPLHPYYECPSPLPFLDEFKLSYTTKRRQPTFEFTPLKLSSDSFKLPGLPFIRFDASLNISSFKDPRIRRGDSIVVSCNSPYAGGLADDGGGPAVYMHVKCAFIGAAPGKPNLYGPALQGTYGCYKSDDGLWTSIQGDTARTGAGKAEDAYMFDLNDSLFTEGYCIEYYFSARDNEGNTSTLPPHADIGQYFEATCLPTGRSDVLYVNDASPIGCLPGPAQRYWDQTFKAVFPPPNDVPDRYDVNDPSAIAAPCGPGGQVRGVDLIHAYRIIIWDCGDFSYSTISDGTFNSDMSDDCQMLIDWMNFSQNSCGLWICGDDVAADLKGLNSSQASILMHEWCGVDIEADSYFDVTGGIAGGGVITPLVSGDADLGLFIHGGTPDRWYVFGGCPIVNEFDVLNKTGTGKIAATYPDYQGSIRAAAVGNNRTNANGCDVRTMWFGFGYQCVRDDMPETPMDRYEIARDIIQWMQGNTNIDISEAAIPRAYELLQNYPNPFNPRTTIAYDMMEKGFVTIKLYNVAGQLVRTLVSGIKEPGSYAVIWDGRNDRGIKLASGVYYYDMETRDFRKSKKMVLLR